MKTILVASENPVKMKAVSIAFKRMFPQEEFQVKGISVESGVNDQPLSDSETLKGAQERIVNAKKKFPGCYYYVGIEGGIEEKNGELESFTWAVVKSKTHIGKGKSATFFIPMNVAKLIHQGRELGDAMDTIFHESNTKQKTGAIGLLTGNVISRTHLYTMAVVIALIPFKQKALYS